MRILVIDDDPKRAYGLVKAGHTVAIAHTWEQIHFWLHMGPWDKIFLDHDMGQVKGIKVVKTLGEHIVGAGCPIRIWSHNVDGARKMLRKLKEHAANLEIDNLEISRMQFGQDEKDQYGPP